MEILWVWGQFLMCVQHRHLFELHHAHWNRIFNVSFSFVDDVLPFSLQVQLSQQSRVWLRSGVVRR